VSKGLKVTVYLFHLASETSFQKGLQKTSKSGDYLLYKIVDDILKKISLVDNAVESRADSASSSDKKKNPLRITLGDFQKVSQL